MLTFDLPCNSSSLVDSCFEVLWTRMTEAVQNSKGWTQTVGWGMCQKAPQSFCISSSLILPMPSFLFFTIFSPIFSLCLSSSRQPHRRYEMQPVCADLQGQILACYRENVGKTLNCSNIAALYLQCVNDAKQVRIYQTELYSIFILSLTSRY